MAELNGNLEPKAAEAALSPEERRIFSQIFSIVDSESLGVVTGDVAIKFLPEKTRLPSEILGEIWQVADPDDKGFVTKAGFFVILRLIGYAQNGRSISPELALKPGPLPRLEGAQMPSLAPLQAQSSGGPIPVPRLSPEKANQYATLFESSGAHDGTLDGLVAKQIFDRAQLPNDILVKIWNLADTEQRGKLSVTEFIIAMHLLASFRSGAMRALPNNLPAGLYEAAARRGVQARSPSGSRTDFPPASAIPRNFTGGSATARTSSPLARQQYTASPTLVQAQPASSDWAIPPNEKTIYDQQFARLDTANAGSIGGEQAVGFFKNSNLPELDLAQIWDLADITQSGRLSQDEFAVAMHLIRQQLNGRGPLPSKLPANLIPPRLRGAAPSAQPHQPQATGTAQAPVNPPRAQSAMDDLFGLDVAAPAKPQVPQSTGGSTAAPPVTAFKSASPAQASSSQFKPFVPSSSFGQSILPQATGQNTSSQRQISADDDLLGDANPEESNKLTQDTVDIANLSNSVNTLTTQSRELQAKAVGAQQELSQSSSQKAQIEAQLTQLRSTYEQEARQLKTIQDQLNASKADTTRLQQDLVMVQHSFQVQQEQKQQVLQGLEADQKENASLKERIAQVQRETAQIKPQIEKMRADARQQKGMVAINKKQLSTIEAEREKNKAELASATNEYHDATRELEESHQALEASKTVENNRAITSPVAITPSVPVASPAASISSMNPFFNRGQASNLAATTPSQPVASPNHSAFDSFFDSTFAPATTNHQAVSREVQHPAASTSGTSTPTRQGIATPLSEPELPPATHQPPPPSISRQMTPSVLPLGDNTPRAPSADSSLGVAPPASQFGDVSELETPAKERESPIAALQHSSVSSAPAYADPVTNGSSVAPASSREIHSPEPMSANVPVPGAFPMTPSETPGFAPQNLDAARDFTPDTTSNEGASNRSAFDAMFGSAAPAEHKDKAPVSDSAFGGQSQTTEFPPIEEFNRDDEDSSDDDTESENGFGQSSQQPTTQTKTNGPSQAAATSLAVPEHSDPSTALPTPNAQSSPPGYLETISPQQSEPRDANQFAREYTGLLPSREDPIAGNSSSIPDESSEPPIPTTSVTAVQHAPAISHPPAPTTHDDFDSAFGDLSEAQTADHTLDEDLHTSARNDFDDFNPVFDSPAPSTKAATLDSSAFHDFESQFSAPTQASTTNTAATSQMAASGAGRPAPSKDDWDAMFAGFGEGQSNGTTAAVAPTTNYRDSSGFSDAFDIPPTRTTTSAPAPAPAAVTPTTEHDDPILKHLTGMGYSRDISVEALEKYDYNLDKAANYLASQS